MRMFCAALSRDGSLGSLSPDHNLGVSPPSKLDKLRCEAIFVIKQSESQAPSIFPDVRGTVQSFSTGLAGTLVWLIVREQV